MTARVWSVSDDPCGRAEALRALRDKIVTGGAALEVEFAAEHTGTRRRVRCGEADLDRLDREINAAEAACGNLKGAKSAARIFYPQTSKGL